MKKIGNHYNKEIRCMLTNMDYPLGSNIGNKHYFFMLEGCKAPGKIRGFHNENLIPELLKHRKVMEVLGAKLMIDSTPGQLSGLGFNATVKDSVIVRLKGSHNRVIKLIF